MSCAISPASSPGTARAASRAPSRGLAAAALASMTGLLLASTIAVAVVAAIVVAGRREPGSTCAASGRVGGLASSPGIGIAPPGAGLLVGASEYGGPGDPTSGTVGASGAGLLAHPDSYAELGGATFQTATAMGGLSYMTPLRITWQGHSAIAYKRDIGLGGGPVAGLPRVIDLWWQLAGALQIPYERGQWSGPVRIARPPGTGAGAALGLTVPAPVLPLAASSCALPVAAQGLPITAGPRAQLLADGRAAAPARAPAAVRGMIAAGNAIAGRPYVYGAGHGLPLDELAPAYDCSSSVEHLLYGGGLLPVSYGAASSSLATWGQPGPGRWVTIYADPEHVFMYVAGLRWDTWNAGGAGDGATGIGWHPLVRDASGFVARHPSGL